MRPAARVIVVVLFALVAAVSAAAFEQSRLTVETARGNTEFRVEVARTADERAQGLQHRERLEADAGMLFDFGVVEPVAMWMKNTRIPLDMVFIDDGGRVVRVAENTVPFSLASIPSGAPVLAVLELNAGMARRLGLKPGDRVRHPLFGVR